MARLCFGAADCEGAQQAGRRAAGEHKCAWPRAMAGSDSTLLQTQTEHHDIPTQAHSLLFPAVQAGYVGRVLADVLQAAREG